MATTFDTSRFGELAKFYRSHLTDNLMAFWDKHGVDRQYGGYIHKLDRQGKPTGDDKNTWCQGRMTYMYGAMYQHIEKRPQYLEFSKLGRDFLVNHAYAGNGRWHYIVDRTGKNVLVPNRSLFADANALMGLSQYAAASGSKEDMAIINATYDALEKNLRTPGFNEFHHFKLDPTLKWHSPNMVVVGLAEVLRPILGSERIKPLLDYALDQVLNFFVKDEYKALFEVLEPNGNVPKNPGFQGINPGHSLECLWFCLEEGLHRKDQKIIDRVVQVMDWAYLNGEDREFGGILNTTSPSGGPPPDKTPNSWGEHWDYKVWWVHSESLYALALAAVTKRDPVMLERFHKLHDFTFKYFPDPEYGEWYEYLTRDNKPVYYDKAKWIKCAFHIPRNIMKLALLMERAGR